VAKVRRGNQNRTHPTEATKIQGYTRHQGIPTETRLSRMQPLQTIRSVMSTAALLDWKNQQMHILEWHNQRGSPQGTARTVQPSMSTQESIETIRLQVEHEIKQKTHQHWILLQG